MTYLLDISVLLAWLWEKHEHHRRVLNWEAGKSIAISPLTELGFLRISTSPVFGATMQQAREMLQDWLAISQALEILRSESFRSRPHRARR